MQQSKAAPSDVPPSSSTHDDEVQTNQITYKTSHSAVRKARRFVLQGLYEWLMTDHRFEKIGHRDWKSNSPHDIAARTRATNAMHTVHLGYYHQLMRDIPEQVDELDALIAEHLDRDISKLDTVEHAILLIGTYELKNSLHVPYKVVLDEAMKLNTHFGATDAHKLINAVLDKQAAQLRAVEVQAEKNGTAGLKAHKKSSKKQSNEKQPNEKQPNEKQTHQQDTDDMIPNHQQSALDDKK